MRRYGVPAILLATTLFSISLASAGWQLPIAIGLIAISYGIMRLTAR